MLPILRSRSSRIVVALLCALVLSRVPASVFAEDTTSSPFQLDEAAAVAIVTVPAIAHTVTGGAIGAPTQASVPCGACDLSMSEHTILRL